MKTLFIIILGLIITSCNHQVDKQATESLADTASIVISVNADTIMLNYKDSAGLKQGIWNSINKQNEREIYTYCNDTLNGFYSVENFPWRHEGYYKKGKMDSIQRTYSGKRVEHLSFHKEGRQLWWVSFAADGGFLVPIKGFHITDDTTMFVVAPYPSGQTWYEGQFISTKCFKTRLLPHFQTFTTGIHRIYFESGKLRGLVDYDHKTITEYDSTGRQIYVTKLNDFKTHKQMVLTMYTE